MKIYNNYCSSSFNIKETNNNQINNVKKEIMPYSNQKGILPSTQLMLSFCGGKSLNLSETIAQIDKLGKYPDYIRQMAAEIIESGNPDNKTLIDVHKSKYASLYSCDTLEEVKFFFPEFQGVLSDSQVPVRENSFIDSVRKGEVPYFDKDKDVTLQLLQMYWGDGISLSDFKKEFADRNIYGVFKKLNIPLLNPVYGHYLGFSDKTKNNIFSESMKHRKNGKLYAAKHRQSIKKGSRGALTEEHKAKISESLKQYYSENPEMVFQLSEANKKYFEENPQQKDVFSQVLLRAWKYPEAKSIKKALRRHMRKHNISEYELADIMNPASINNNHLKTFWDNNVWAKDKFSVCMTKSWARQKELSDMGLIYEPLASVDLLPKTIQDCLLNSPDSDKESVRKYTSIVLPDFREKNCAFSDDEKLICYCEFLESLESIKDYEGENPIFKYEYIRLAGIADAFQKIEKLSLKSGAEDVELFNYMKKEFSDCFNYYMHDGNGDDKFFFDLDKVYSINLLSVCLQTGHRAWFDIFINSMNSMDKLCAEDENAVQKIAVDYWRNIFLEYSPKS